MQMNFSAMLVRAGLKKADLARALGVTPGTVSRWKETPPQTVLAYLRAVIELNRYRP
jgi:DNA-binding transcriptional regulator YiaG